MKTIITETIDGYEVIKNFGELSIDPFETEKIVKPIIEESDEYNAIQKKKKEIWQRIMLSGKALSAARKAYQIAQSNVSSAIEKEQALKDYEKHNSDYRLHNSMITELQKDIPVLATALKNRRKQEVMSNAVYFETPHNEEIIEPAVMVDLMNAANDMPGGMKLLKSGNYIEDNRGRVYYTCCSDTWEKTIVEVLGVTLPEDSIWQEDLTDEQKQEIVEQIELERIARLSTLEKEAEKEALIENTAYQATTMRSKLEIQGETADDALTLSQEWYKTEVALLETKYA